eukprot:27292_1
MGLTHSTDTVTAEINNKLSADRHNQAKIQKMLFLGPGGSGKSTILKQLQWLHLDGFSKQAALNLKHYIYVQTVSQMKNVILHYETTEEKRTYNDDIKLQNAIATVKKDMQHSAWTLSDTTADAIQYIWNNDEKIKKVFTDYEVFTHNTLDESTEHFWNQLDRIKAPNYIPNEDDILNVRCKTTGAVEKQFTIKKTIFTVTDVGGQKSERRKWIGFFNDVSALLFVTSLSSYDQTMWQDGTKNCMVDALELFESIVNNKHFESTSVILFLNKRDLFEKKIRKVPLTVCPAFSDYNEFDHGTDIFPNPHDYEQTTTYIRRKFMALKKGKGEKVVTHLTYAMDRKNIDVVFVGIHRSIIANNLGSCMISVYD